MLRIAMVVLVAAAVWSPAAAAKEFASIVLVGADGRSLELRPGADRIDALFGGRTEARRAGGYVRVYVLGPTGHVGVPGRFYPRSQAVCFDWDQSRAPRACRRTLVPLRAEARGLARFHGPPTTVARLRSLQVRSSMLRQLEVVFELAFDRSRLARPARRPARCIEFEASWRGAASARRPRRSCLSPRGVFAAGRLYPLGPEPFRLAALNPP